MSTCKPPPNLLDSFKTNPKGPMDFPINLVTAQTLAANIDASTRIFENSTRSILQTYIDFVSEHVPRRAPTRFQKAEEYSFVEVESRLFVFESEEYNYYGEYIKDTVEVPFDFVDNPTKHMNDIIESNRVAEANRVSRTKAAAQAKVEKLKRELAEAERVLESK